ncbi:MAG: oligosaccharide flippase family protein [Porticoccaceae bacterium]|nr:oligosaccharide flippase family protein [Porticoccaceae bacterium]
MNFRSALVRQVSLSFILNSFNIVFLLMTTVILARNMGADAFGTYVVQLSVVTLLSVLISYGMPTFLTREIAISAGHNDLSGAYAAIRFALIVSSILLIVLFTGLAAINAYYEPIFLIQFGSGAIIFLIGKVYSDIFSGVLVGFGEIFKGKLVHAVLAAGIFLIIQVYVVLLLGRVPTIEKVFYMQAAGVIFSSILGAYWTVNILHRQNITSRKQIKWKLWMGECHPLILINGIAAFNQNIILIILGLQCTPEAVGLYRIADRVSAFSLFLRNSITSVVSPMIARGWVLGKKGEIENTLRTVCVTNVLFNASFFTICVIAGKPIISIFFGAEYVDSWLPLILLTLGYFIGSISGFNGALLTMSSHAKVVSLILGATVVLQIVLTIPLAHLYMAFGAAISAALTIVANALLLWWQAKKRTGLNCSIISSLDKAN